MRNPQTLSHLLSKNTISSGISKLLILAFFGTGLLGCYSLHTHYQGDYDWVAHYYGEAILQSDTSFMRRHLIEGREVEDVPRNPRAAALHVIRTCVQEKQNHPDEKILLVLFGGKVKNSVYGIDMVVKKDGATWRVKDAHLSMSSTGRPMLYLRNCEVDLASERIDITADLPRTNQTSNTLGINDGGKGNLPVKINPFER